jgi:NAD(P)-dependent dehydrogenase (short-subunit alcohol dehydrogenase family)
LSGGTVSAAAIVTEAASAIGQAVVRRLSRAGMGLVIGDAAAAELAALARELEAEGSRVVALVADLADPGQAPRLAEAAISEFGRIDALVTGLGQDDPGDWRDMPPGQLANSTGARVDRTLQCIRAVISHMVAGGGGRIVTLVSSLGRYRSAWFRSDVERGSAVLRAGVESAIVGLTRQLAFELAPHRIRVNAVAAGWIRLPAFEQAWQALSAREQAFVLEEISLRRRGEPDELAAAIEFLASEASRYVTGTTIDVNGGWWVS